MQMQHSRRLQIVEDRNSPQSAAFRGMRASVRQAPHIEDAWPAASLYCITSRHVSVYSNRSILPIAKAVKQTIELLQLSVSNKRDKREAIQRSNEALKSVPSEAKRSDKRSEQSKRTDSV